MFGNRKKRERYDRELRENAHRLATIGAAIDELYAPGGGFEHREIGRTHPRRNRPLRATSVAPTARGVGRMGTTTAQRAS